MKIIDAHMHFSNIQAFYSAAEEAGVDYSYTGYLNECVKNGIDTMVCMGLGESKPHTFPDKNAQMPMLADLHEKLPVGLHTCIGINPHMIDDVAINKIREKIKADEKVVGFKIYAGYYHYFIHDKIYDPIYKLAAEFGLTVAIHTGVTYSEQGLMEYSHPLAADRLAVKYRDVNFLLCHMGNPWIMDASEVTYKNRNVFMDISGLVEGNAEHIQNTLNEPLLMNHYMTGLKYLNNYKKILFGTDWPIVPLKAYINFCKIITPSYAYEDVFRENAKKLYNLKT